MDNQKGGQSGTVPSWNAWGQAAAKDAANKPTQSHATTGELTSAQKQQQTVTALARQKLLDAYNKQGNAAAAEPKPEQKPATPAQKTAPAQAKPVAAQPAKQNPVPNVSTEDWRKYHSAWQQYYQKYYGEYYGRAAKEYVARERLKYERNLAETGGDDIMETVATSAQSTNTTESEEIQSGFKARIQKKVAKRAKKMRKSRHFVPLIIGGSILVLGLLFQYNQVIIANAVAWMSPGGSEVNDIMAIDPTVSANIHEKPTLMIPKLNVEVPVVFGSKNDVDSMGAAMNNGVAHFAISGASAKPGQIGNFVVSGHSAGNIYQASDYKFIFSGLTRMGNGDLIYMDYESQRYTYRVTGTRTVDPSDTGSLRKIASDNSGKPMITLITCTPLGTSKYRLLVYGEQIHPSYGDDTASQQSTPSGSDSQSEQTMPKNDDSPLEQFWKWLTGQS